MSDDSWFGDTKSRKCVTVGLLILLVVVSCWTYSNISSFNDDNVVNIVYPEHIPIIEDVAHMSIEETVIGEDVENEESNNYPIINYFINKRFERLERIKDLFR